MKNGDIVIFDKGLDSESEVQIKAIFDDQYCMINNVGEPRIGFFVMISRLTPKTIK